MRRFRWVKLCDGSKARIGQLRWLCPEMSTWHWFGYDREENPHLWKRDGSWRRDGKEHPLDIPGAKIYKLNTLKA